MKIFLTFLILSSVNSKRREKQIYQSQSRSSNASITKVYNRNDWPKYGPVRRAFCIQSRLSDGFRVTPTYDDCEHAVRDCSKFASCNVVVRYKRPTDDQPWYDIGDVNAKHCPSFAESSTEVSYLNLPLFNRPTGSSICRNWSAHDNKLFIQPPDNQSGFERAPNAQNSSLITYGPVPGAICILNKQGLLSISPTYDDCEAAVKDCLKKRLCNIVVAYQLPDRRQKFDIGNTHSRTPCKSNVHQNTNAVPVYIKNKDYYEQPHILDICDRISTSFDNDFQQRNRRSAEKIFRCAHFGGKCTKKPSQMCTQLFDSEESAQIACGISSDCTHVAKQNSAYQIWASHYETSIGCQIIPKMYEVFDRSTNPTNTTITNIVTVIEHSALPITQVSTFDIETRITRHFMPKHLNLQEATTFIYHDEGYKVTLLEKDCLIEFLDDDDTIPMENTVLQINYKKDIKYGTVMKVEEKFSTRTVEPYLLPLPIRKTCANRQIIQHEIIHLSDTLTNSTIPYNTYKKQIEPAIEPFFQNGIRSRRETYVYKECKNSYCDDDELTVLCGTNNCKKAWCLFKNTPSNTRFRNKWARRGEEVTVWKHIVREGIWCMPCCNGKPMVPAMANCYNMIAPSCLCQHVTYCKRCGDSDFSERRQCRSSIEDECFTNEYDYDYD